VSEVARQQPGFRSHQDEGTPQRLRRGKCQQVKPIPAFHRRKQTRQLPHLLQGLPQRKSLAKESMRWYEAV